MLDRAEEMIRETTLPSEWKQGLLSEIDAIRSEPDDLDNEEDSGDDPENPLPSLREVLLSTSHMFFDDPYAALDDEEIDAQVEARSSAYRAAIDKALGQAGRPFLESTGLSEEAFETGDDFGPLEELLWQGFAWVWPVEDVVFFLMDFQEDRELPRTLSFGRARRAEFAAIIDAAKQA